MGKLMHKLPRGVRTLKCWALYRPGSKFIFKSYLTKKEALENQAVGEVIVEMKGIYSVGMVKGKLID